MVNTLDFESSDPSSNLGGTYKVNHVFLSVENIGTYFKITEIELEETEIFTRNEMRVSNLLCKILN